MISKLKSVSNNDKQDFEYHQLDVRIMRNIKDFCNDFIPRHDPHNGGQGLHALILCAGGLNYGPRKETAEG